MNSFLLECFIRHLWNHSQGITAVHFPCALSSQHALQSCRSALGQWAVFGGGGVETQQWGFQHFRCILIIVAAQRTQAANPSMTGNIKRPLSHAPGLPVRHQNIGVRGGGGTGWWAVTAALLSRGFHICGAELIMEALQAAWRSPAPLCHHV